MVGIKTVKAHGHKIFHFWFFYDQKNPTGLRIYGWFIPYICSNTILPRYFNFTCNIIPLLSEYVETFFVELEHWKICFLFTLRMKVHPQSKFDVCRYKNSWWKKLRSEKLDYWGPSLNTWNRTVRFCWIDRKKQCAIAGYADCKMKQFNLSK